MQVYLVLDWLKFRFDFTGFSLMFWRTGTDMRLDMVRYRTIELGLPL
jgi:hypothetical protein